MSQEFRRLVAVQKSGCWLWEGKSTPHGHPTFRRQLAWKWAYQHGTGRELPRKSSYRGDGYPTIPGCAGPLFCVFPDHRVNLPEDQAQLPHRCSVCQAMHDPSEDPSPPVEPKRKRVVADWTTHSTGTKKLGVTSDGLQELTPEQQAVEDMMGDYD
jgi:hypothetical protein